MNPHNAMSPQQTAAFATQTLEELAESQEDVTVNELAEHAGVSTGAARAAIKRALKDGTLQHVGYEETGKRGRPPALYATA